MPESTVGGTAGHMVADRVVWLEVAGSCSAAGMRVVVAGRLLGKAEEQVEQLPELVAVGNSGLKWMRGKYIYEQLTVFYHDLHNTRIATTCYSRA